MYKRRHVRMNWITKSRIDGSDDRHSVHQECMGVKSTWTINNQNLAIYILK